MTDENNATIQILHSAEAYPPTNYTNVTAYAKEFTIKNAGLLKTPEVTVVLNNKDGLFTSGGTPIEKHNILKITADVRGVVDRVFFGRVTNRNSKNQKKQEVLTLTGRGFSQKLLQDIISKQFLTDNEEKVATFSMKTAIEYMLLHPDSGFDTGVILLTDTGDISTVTAKHNFDREWLLDAIAKCCEYIGYTGYEDTDDDNIQIRLHPYGYSPTNPYITFGDNADGNEYKIIEREYEDGTEEIFNHIMVWAKPNAAYPSRDYYCEGGYASSYWAALNGECVVSDSTDYSKVNDKSIKIIKSAGSLTTMGAVLTFPVVINATTRMATHISFALKTSYGNECIGIELKDSNNRTVFFGTTVKASARQYADGWMIFEIPIGKMYRVNAFTNWHIREVGDYPHAGDEWTMPSAQGTFDWDHIVTATIKAPYVPAATAVTWYLDGLHWVLGTTTTPLEDSSLVAYDTDSINAYGRRVMPYDEPSVSKYDVIGLLGQKILLSTKNPVRKLSLTCGAKTWVNPNQYLTVTQARYGISSEQWRIVEIEHKWSTLTKLLRTKLSLTPRYSPVTSREWYRGQLEQLITGNVW